MRQFLRGLGVRLEGGGAVVRQARVTALADSAGPGELAALVAEASGLGELVLLSEQAAAAAMQAGAMQAGCLCCGVLGGRGRRSEATAATAPRSLASTNPI